MIVIDEAGDLTIQVIEYKDGLENINSNQEMTDSEDTNGQNSPIRQMEEFRVCRKVLVKQSEVFQKLLTTWSAEAKLDVITLEEDRVFAMEIWFRQMHGTLTENNSRSVSLPEMWHLTAAADKYDLCILDLKEWFYDWYSRKPTVGDDKKLLEARQLLYPCYRFDHAIGFARATKYLAYTSTGHITEDNPTNHEELHLPHRMIQQINAAKGRLRTLIHSELFVPNEELLQAGCSCKETTLFGYEKTLYNIGVWPLERTAQKSSMKQILDRLENFDYKPQEKACIHWCQQSYNFIAQQAHAITRTYFDGLCLDCMDNSKSHDPNNDYWRHNGLNKRVFDRGCRFKHKEPTWYFSFMGRKEDRDHFRKSKNTDTRGRFH